MSAYSRASRQIRSAIREPRSIRRTRSRSSCSSSTATELPRFGHRQGFPVSSSTLRSRAIPAHSATPSRCVLAARTERATTSRLNARHSTRSRAHRGKSGRCKQEPVSGHLLVMTVRPKITAALTVILLAGCSGVHRGSPAPSPDVSRQARPSPDVALVYQDGFTGQDEAAYVRREHQLTALAFVTCSWLINPESNGGSNYVIHLRVPASAAARDLRIVAMVDPHSSAHLAPLSALTSAPKLTKAATQLAARSGAKCR